MKTANKLKLHRIANSKSVSQIANYLAMSDGNYRKIEKGEVKICFENVFKLALLYKLRLEEFLPDEQQKNVVLKLSDRTSLNNAIGQTLDEETVSKILVRDEEIIRELKSEINLLKQILEKNGKLNGYRKQEKVVLFKRT